MTTEVHPPSSFDDDALDRAFAQASRTSASRSRRTRRSRLRRGVSSALAWPQAGPAQRRLRRWLKAAPPAAKKSVGERFKVLKDLVESLLEQAAGSGPERRRARRRVHRHHPARHAAAHRRRTPHHAHAERDCAGLRGAGLLGRRGAGSRNRLLQLRVA